MSRAKPLSLRLYRVAMGLAEPAAPLLLKNRARHGKEAPDRLSERLGRPSLPRPDGPLVWLHGASVGEGVSLLPLVERIRAERPDTALLITTGTRTSAELLAGRLPAGAIHQFVPLDAPAAITRFLGHWRPDLAVFVESELWPNLILAARARGMRMALVSARMTEASARGWARDRKAARAVLDAFDLILPQDRASARRVQDLGGRPAGQLNLKRAGAPLAADAGEAAALEAAIGARQIVLAASTHASEEMLIAPVVRGLKGAPLLIIAPRHPARGDAIAAELRQAGFSVARRSEGRTDDLDRVDVYLADTLGEIGILYRLADIVVMGGGFVPGVGGHNPLEAARLGVGVVSGPHVANHADVYDEMVDAGGAVIVQDPAELARELNAILALPQRRLDMGGKAAGFAVAQGDAFEEGWRHIAPLLPAP